MIAIPPTLEGQTAAVTGGTHGLGRDLALALARAGADIVVMGRDAAAGAEAVQAVNAAGRRGLFVPADVSDEAAMDAASALAADSFGKIDILVCAAGVGVPRRPVWESVTADFRTCFDVNVLGVMLALRAFLPGMIARRAGRAVIIGGTYGHKGVADHAIYAASKWAIRGLVKSAALEAGPHNVTVNTIAPGGVDGDRLRRLFRQSAEARGESEDAVLARFTSGTALGRLVDGDDIAATLLYLLGDGGRNITGQDIIVDSGTII
jgi:NAD(P)-dependent dehydrogenase (short-subunit alcohol dehydrogenase family)